MMSALIDRMDRWLQINRPDYYARLRPGVSDSRLDEFEAQFSVKLPESFRLLYGWRDGQEMMCSESIQMNLMFVSLDDITTTKEMLDGMIGFDFKDPRWWRRSWIPFLHNGGGDHLCVDLAAEDGGTPGQLLMFYHDWEARPVRFPDLEAWLSDLVESMENGSLKLM